MLRRIITLSVAAFLLLIVVGCERRKDHTGGTGTQSQTSTEQRIAKEITVGAVLPLTGPVASYGKNAQSGVDMAVEEIAAHRQITIKVIYEDHEGKPQTAVSAAQKLISSNKVPLIIGEAASGLSMAIAPVCNRNTVVLFSPISSASELTEKGGDYFFRVCPSDAFQARILAQWLIDKGLKTTSVIFVNNSWGSSLKDEFVASYDNKGGKILGIEACKEGDRDFKSHITKMAAGNPMAFVGFTYGKEGGPFLRQTKELGVGVPMYGGDVWGSPELLEAAGEAAEGVYFTFPASPSGDLYESFANRYNNRFQKEPDIYAAYAYDLTQIIANAVDSGAMTGPDIRQYLLNMHTYTGVTGLTRFDSKGDVVTKTFDRKVIRNGKYMPAE